MSTYYTTPRSFHVSPIRAGAAAAVAAAGRGGGGRRPRVGAQPARPARVRAQVPRPLRAALRPSPLPGERAFQEAALQQTGDHPRRPHGGRLLGAAARRPHADRHLLRGGQLGLPGEGHVQRSGQVPGPEDPAAPAAGAGSVVLR